MYKHLVLLLTLMTGVATMQAQTTITLSFTAIHNGLHQPLDSISISNLTQGGDTTLYGTDTVLVLDHGIGINDMVSNHCCQLILYPAYPNPLTHTSTVRLWLPQDEPVALRLFDLPGRKLATFNGLLGAGEHIFTFTPGGENIYMLIAEAPDQRVMQKLINLRPGEGSCHISYSGYHPVTAGIRKEKSSFPWVPGDDLSFFGFTSYGVESIDDNPTQSATYTFNFQAIGLPCIGIPTVTDYNGNIYNTIQLGTQCWMRENLKARNYRNGISIPNVTIKGTWFGLITGARCWYDNDSAAYAKTYGALYNWYAVNDSSGLCPIGWHVPYDTEWQTLEMHLGMVQAQAGSIEWRGIDEGGKMKGTGLAYWNSPNTGATNSSGFTALPGGYRGYINGYFSSATGEGDFGCWWSSSAHSTSPYAWYREMSYEKSGVYRHITYQKSGFSVRCLKD